MRRTSFWEIKRTAAAMHDANTEMRKRNTDDRIMLGRGQRCGGAPLPKNRFFREYLRSCNTPVTAFGTPSSLHLRCAGENRRGFAKARIRRKTTEFTESNAENPSTLQVLPTYFSFIFILAFFQKIRMFKIIGAVQNIFAAGSIRHGFGTRQIKNICKARSAYGERKTPMLDRIALILVIIGAINWGSIGLFRFDIVGWLFGGAESVLSRIIFSVVALAGLWCISLLFRRRAESRE